MLVAVDSAGGRRVATPELRGTSLACPDCRELVVVRAGSRVVAHFAHRSGTACSEAREAMRKRREAARKSKRSSEAKGQQYLFELEPVAA